MKQFNTYLHRRKDNNEVFYIGEGNKKRPFVDTTNSTRSSQRSKEWYDVKDQAGGVIVEILANWNSKEEAIQHEKLLIACFNNSPLVNKTDGGTGMKLGTKIKGISKGRGIPKSKEYRANKKTEYKTSTLRAASMQSYTCFHCKKDINGLGNLKRWHNEKCREELYP